MVDEGLHLSGVIQVTKGKDYFMTVKLRCTLGGSQEKVSEKVLLLNLKSQTGWWIISRKTRGKFYLKKNYVICEAFPYKVTGIEQSVPKGVKCFSQHHVNNIWCVLLSDWHWNKWKQSSKCYSSRHPVGIANDFPQECNNHRGKPNKRKEHHTDKSRRQRCLRRAMNVWTQLFVL